MANLQLNLRLNNQTCSVYVTPTQRRAWVLPGASCERCYLSHIRVCASHLLWCQVMGARAHFSHRRNGHRGVLNRLTFINVWPSCKCPLCSKCSRMLALMACSLFWGKRHTSRSVQVIALSAHTSAQQYISQGHAHTAYTT